jgi:EpsI family protein
LEEVPLKIDSWTGLAEPVDPRFLERTRPDEILNRRYVNDAGRAVSLYVAYYTRQASRSQVSPACPGECAVIRAGLDSVDIGGHPLFVSRVQVRQDGIRMTALYWYQEGNSTLDPGNQRKVEWLMRAFRRHRSNGALVRVSVPLDTSEGEAQERSRTFVKAVFPYLQSILTSPDP